MRVYIVSYRTAKYFAGKHPPGYAFGYHKTSRIWGSFCQVVGNDPEKGVTVYPLDSPRDTYMLPVCCIRGKYAREALYYARCL